ncbi:MAG: hypothetical protein V4706_02725 [Pseudomonadota bacterium]
MNKPDIIGLTGLAFVGKDTVAQLLQTHLRFAQLAFADPLRGEICTAYGCPTNWFTKRETKETDNPELALLYCRNYEFVGLMLRNEAARVPGSYMNDFLEAPRSPRWLMQQWGTEYRRKTTHENYWTRNMIARIRSHQDGHQWRTVISDVRFENEAECIRSMGGVIWQVKRPGVAHDTSHVSESDGSQFKPDLVIDNDADLIKLRLLVVGSWIQREADLSAFDVFRMGLAHQASAAQEWHAAAPTPQTTGATA